MEVGAIIGALIFFFIILPTMFPKTRQKMIDWVDSWDQKD